jgi:hypothetical protein
MRPTATVEEPASVATSTAGRPRRRDGMSKPMRDPMQRQLTSGRRSIAALLPGEPRPSTETSLPGHLCEVCLDAPAVHLRPASWGGEMGVCEACHGREACQACRDDGCHGVPVRLLPY